MSLLDSSLLCEFLRECQLPETIEIVEGYDSNESAEMSWSSGETVYLHAMKDVTQVLALDRKGNRFCIPLNYPEKIFEGIPNRCSDRYENVGELIVEFPKYVRSLQNIPHSGVKVGDILCPLETSSKVAGCAELKCKVVGNARPVTLSEDQLGPFETLEDIEPITMRDITDKHLLPTRVRVRAGGRRFCNQTNISKVMLEGLFTIQEIAQEKVLIVYTLYEKDLRVVKVPIDLEIRVKRKTSKLDPKMFTEICRRIDEEVNIESTITTGNRAASWFFDISDTEQDLEAAQPDDFYEEIVPRLPPRSPSNKPTGPNSNQYTRSNKPPDNEIRYVPPSQLKPRRKPDSLVVVKETGKSGPPPVAKKPSMDKRNSCHSQMVTDSDCPTNTNSRNDVKSHTERRRAEAQSHCNRPEKAGDNTRHSGGSQSVSPVTPKAANKHQASVFPKGSTKPVSPTLCKPKPNDNTQNPPKEKSPNSHHPIPPMHDSIVSEKCRESEENPTKLTSKNIKPNTISKRPEVNNNCSTLGLAQLDRVFIGDTLDVSPTKAKPAREPVDPIAARESVKALSLPLGKPTPDVTIRKPLEKEETLSSLDTCTGSPLENPSSRFKKSDSEEIATKVTSHNIESHKRTVKLGGDAGMVQGQAAKELLGGISVSEVCTWLTKLGLTEHVDRFENESIDGDLLLELDAEMMLHLGISNPLQRKKLELFIRKGWTPKKS